MNNNPADNSNKTGKHVNPKTKKKKKSPAGKIVLFAVLALVIVLGIYGSRFLFAPKVAVADETRTAAKTVGTDIFSVRNEAGFLKDNLKLMAECIKTGDMDAADSALEAAEVNMLALQTQLDSDVWSSAENAPVIGKEITSVKKLLEIADAAIGDIVTPLMNVIRENPLNEFKVGDAFNAALVYPYVDYLQEIAPDLRVVCDEMQTLDLNLVDREHKISGYTELLAELMDVYDEYHDLLPMLNDILGKNGDRTYLLIAQNSSEIRAAGGFPGAVGAIYISDHIAYFEDFASIYDFTERQTPKECKITDIEAKLFSTAVYRSHDACNIPDFERMASIIATSTERQLAVYARRDGNDPNEMDLTIHGAISMTPTIIQRMLSFLGEITLSNGVVLNGENATRYLQHDLYFDYLSKSGPKDGAELSDRLFAETAKSAFSLVTSTFSISHIMDYVNLFRDCVADRTIMVWMKDKEEEDIFREIGWTGSLNHDPMKPQAGVYFSLLSPNKLGWFLDIDTEIGEYQTNADGSRTYKMTCTLRNNLTEEELEAGSEYIIGFNHGSIYGGIYLFGPAGGSVSNFRSSNGRILAQERYEDLDVGYYYVFINAGEPVVITYDLTTAPGVTEDLTISATPTLTAYR